MRKTFKMIGLSVALLSASSLWAKAEACFNCYCNGDYVGCLTTIQYCWNACQPNQDTTLQSEPLTCSEEVREEQTVFICSSDNPASE